MSNSDEIATRMKEVTKHKQELIDRFKKVCDEDNQKRIDKFELRLSRFVLRWYKLGYLYATSNSQYCPEEFKDIEDED